MSIRALAVAVLLALACAQPALSQGPTHAVWVLDAGNQILPTPVIHVLTPDGQPVIDLPVPGASQTRALTMDMNGNAWICRGDNVYKLDRNGANTGLVLAPPAGSNKAQDVEVDRSGNIWVAWGVTAATSRIAQYDPAGSLVTSWSDASVDHPRRLALGANQPIDTVYIASRANTSIVALDVNTGNFSLVSDLSGSNIGPVGLAFDPTDNDVWVAGDYGQTQVIGRVDVTSTPSSFVQELNYGASVVGGLSAPGGIVLDRFSRLYVASRNQNGGTAEVAIFKAETTGQMPYIGSFPATAPPTPWVNIIDLGLQPALATSCALTEGDRQIIVQGAVHTVKIEAPAHAGSAFVAGLSFQWHQVCGPLPIPGNLEPNFLTFGFPDPRGIPLALDEIFIGTAGVGLPGQMPPLLALFQGLQGAGNPHVQHLFLPFSALLHAAGFQVSGFAGLLDPLGRATLTIDLSLLPSDPAWNGLELTLAWLLVDFNSLNGFGVIAEPLCLKLRVPAAVPLGATSSCP